MTQKHPVIQIIDDHALSSSLSSYALVRLSRLKACHDRALGTHLLECNNCTAGHIVANTCKGMHCPSCSFVKTRAWIDNRLEELVNCSYFHNVFTLPKNFNTLFQFNFKVMSGILFKAVSETLNSFAGKETSGNKPGFMLFLHTWDQQLHLHFHIHAVIAGGYLNKYGKWVDATSGTNSDYLFNVFALQRVFRGKFITLFNEAFDAGDLDWSESIPRSDFLGLLPKTWVVYSKHTGSNSEKVIKYLGHYTHRTGIAKSRISYDGKSVRLICKNRKVGGTNEIVLTPDQFLQRFSQHFFQEVVQRVRYFGFLSNSAKGSDLPNIRSQLGLPNTTLVKALPPACSECGGTSFTFISIQWTKAPLLHEAKRIQNLAQGPPSWKVDSVLVRPLIGATNLTIDKLGPRTHGGEV